MMAVACALLIGATHGLRTAPHRLPQRVSSRSFEDPLRLNDWRPSMRPRHVLKGTATTLMVPFLFDADVVRAEAQPIAKLDPMLSLDPTTFQPVCPTSDGFYRFAQAIVTNVVGAAAFKEYAPLIAGGLLRVRLELCVVESFYYEAILPFIRENGLTWVLPLHETVETFLAGTIFAVATNFILIGSTKILTVLITYTDFFIGFPFRTIGGFGWRALEDKATELDKGSQAEPESRPWWRGKPARVSPPIEKVIEANSKTNLDKSQLAIWGGLLGFGKLSGGIRQAAEAIDLFVGRYLLLTTFAYVGIKFIHFKIWDPVPF